MRCFQCKGPWHPATGHVLTAEECLCGQCARRFFTWMVGHLQRRWGGHDFYAAAATSIREGVFPPPTESG